MTAEAWDFEWDEWLPDSMDEAPPRPVPGSGGRWLTDRGGLRMAGPVPAAPMVAVLAAAAVAGLAGVAVYAWRRDWPRLAVCAVLAAGCGWLAVRLAVSQGKE